MLECGTNFKSTISESCKQCNKTDDENHRLNECSMLCNVNRANNPSKLNFLDVYSNDKTTLDTIMSNIETIWEFFHANGRMKKA